MRVTEMRKRVLGAEHFDTLVNMVNLARTYRSLRRKSGAICLMQDDALKLGRRLGLEHPNAISARDMLDRWRLPG